MKNNQNDERIMKLKQKIAEQKKQLKKSERFSPITNCSVELDGIRHNLNVLNKEKLIDLAVKLNVYQMSCDELGFGEYVISGYPVADWIEDIKSRLAILSRKEEENKLKAYEAQLHKLLSNDKKVELEIDAIANSLGE